MPLTGADQVGWLLRANRTLGPAGDLRSGRAFAAAFRTDGQPALAPSQITRWETGALTAGRATVRRYERLLGLEPESLVTVRDALYRTLPAARRPSPGSLPARPAARLHDLLDLATSSDPLTGRQWSELTELIESRADLVLHPPRLWESVAHKLLDELTRHEGTGWLQRQEAASRLLEHPTAGGHVVRACIALIEDRSSPAVIEPMGLLEVRSDPVGNEYVLRQLESPDGDRHYRGALLAAVRKIEDGHFEGAQWRRVGRALGTNSAAGDDGRLLSSARAALAHRSGPSRTSSGSRVAAGPPDRVPSDRLPPDRVLADRVLADRGLADRGLSGRVPSGRAVADRAGAGWAGADRVPAGRAGADRVLAGLVVQALGPSVEERLVAAMTIAQSPYRDRTAAGLLAQARRELAGRGGGDEVPAMLQTLTLLGTDIHRPLLFDLLTGGGHDVQVRQAAAWATAHCPGRFTEQQWRRILRRQATAWQRRPVAVHESVLHAIAYGIGTDRHRDLLAEIGRDSRLPAVARTTATWLGG